MGKVIRSGVTVNFCSEGEFEKVPFFLSRKRKEGLTNIWYLTNQRSILKARERHAYSMRSMTSYT